MTARGGPAFIFIHLLFTPVKVAGSTGKVSLFSNSRTVGCVFGQDTARRLCVLAKGQRDMAIKVKEFVNLL